MINNLTSSNPSSGGGNLTGINSKKSSGGENQKNKIEKIDENHQKTFLTNSNQENRVIFATQGPSVAQSSSRHDGISGQFGKKSSSKNGENHSIKTPGFKHIYNSFDFVTQQNGGSIKDSLKSKNSISSNGNTKKGANSRGKSANQRNITMKMNKEKIS